MEEKRNLWMPLNKSADGTFIGILSDDSIDRDEEFMTKELLTTWSRKTAPLPMLANHENKLEKLIGGWTDKRVVSKDGHYALIAKPFFFKSNPLGVQAENMVKEALEMGMGIGISIGAIPKGEMVEKKINGQVYRGFNDAEILEATIVPLQSNRNASFSALAKSFDIQNKEDDINMVEEIKKEETVAEAELVKEVAEEVSDEEEAVKEEEKVEPEPVVEEEKVDGQAEVDALKSENAELKKQIEKLNSKAILKATVEGPQNHEDNMEQDESLTVEKMLKLRYKN